MLKSKVTIVHTTLQSQFTGPTDSPNTLGLTVGFESDSKNKKAAVESVGSHFGTTMSWKLTILSLYLKSGKTSTATSNYYTGTAIMQKPPWIGLNHKVHT